MKQLGIAIIWLVTAYDVWCCQWLTPATEQNPLAALILVWGGVWWLVSLKIVGTFLATEMLRWLRPFYTAVMTGLMLLLTCYLTLG